MFKDMYVCVIMHVKQRFYIKKKYIYIYIYNNHVCCLQQKFKRVLSRKKMQSKKKKTKNRYYHYVRSRGEILNCYINEWALLNVSADSSFACDG